VLYSTTLAVRAFFLVAIAGLYLETRDRMFLVIWGVVALGVALTLIGYVVERRKARSPRPTVSVVDVVGD
jgi:multisubunit Na+/H+ antiporter MnhC subunit